MKTKGVYAAGGLVGAVLASTCCVAPFVFLLLGISGAWISHLTALAPFQPIFLLTSLGFLAVGYWKVYGQSQGSCEECPSCGTTRSDRTVKIVLWMATLIIVTAISVERVGIFFVRGVAMKPLMAILGICGLLSVTGNLVAKEQTVTLTVENMTCSLCPLTVRKALQAVEGVQETKISLADNKASIIFDDDQTGVETLMTTTTNAGFPSALAKEEEIDDY